MTKQVSREETLKQSKRAFARWGKDWKRNATENWKLFKEYEPLTGKGTGREVCVFSFGPSLKENLRDMKARKMHYRCDIMCVDKALKTLLEFGIVPKYVVLADAQVPFKYGDVDPNIVKSVTLISCITGNHEWVKHWSDNGGKVYFYYNKDAIETHKVYSECMGAKYHPTETIKGTYLIPAASNVGNSTCVLATLVLNYEAVYLMGYDYCYKMGGNYYGNDKITGDMPVDTNYKVKKHNFNNHATGLDCRGDLVQYSMNMNFSSRWLIDFFTACMKANRKLRAINLTGHGILFLPLMGELIR